MMSKWTESIYVGPSILCTAFFVSAIFNFEKEIGRNHSTTDKWFLGTNPRHFVGVDENDKRNKLIDSGAKFS